MKTKHPYSPDPCKLDSEAVLLAAGIKRPLWRPDGKWSYIDVIGSHFFPALDTPAFMTMMVVNVDVVCSETFGVN